VAKILIHQSPQGALAIVGVPGVVEPGQPFEVADTVAESLLVQSDLYRVASKADIQAAKAAQTTSEGDPE